MAILWLFLQLHINKPVQEIVDTLCATFDIPNPSSCYLWIPTGIQNIIEKYGGKPVRTYNSCCVLSNRTNMCCSHMHGAAVALTLWVLLSILSSCILWRDHVACCSLDTHTQPSLNTWYSITSSQPFNVAHCRKTGLENLKRIRMEEISVS